MNKIKTFITLFLILVCTIPFFAETITIDKDKLATIIKTEVQKQVDIAVNAAVAIAVKEVETKYIKIVADKDKEIVLKNADIQKLNVDIKALKIDVENQKIIFNNYKLNHGLKRDFIIGSISLSAGIAIGVTLISLLK
jgi:hypothetical protein